MTALRIENFGGMAPRLDPYALPPNGAQIADDCRLHAGVLRGFRRAASISDPPTAVPSGTKTIFYDDVEEVWYSWTSEVDVVVGPVADPSGARRYYYTGDGKPKKTDATMAVTGPGSQRPYSWLYLEVPPPGNAPTASNDNLGTGTPEDHVYVVTYVSEFSGIEEESAPSPPHTVVGWQPGDTVTITRNNTPPTTGYNITKWRIYRSNGGDYLFVGEVAIATDTYADGKLNDALGEALSTIDFDTPPSDLHSLVSLPNGALAGISGNELCFSEPYQPHAWPAKYRRPIPDIPVGLIAVAQGVYVGTKGRPAFCYGIHPSGMTLEWSPKYAPCLSRRSLATDGNGVLYATYNGVAYQAGTEVSMPSAGLITLEEWGAYNPSSMIGAFHADRYYLWYTTLSGTKAGLMFDRTVAEAPFVRSQHYTDAFAIRPDTGLLYVVENGEVKETDADTVNVRVPYRWKSKVFVTPRPVNFAFAQLLLDVDLAEQAEEIAQNQALNEAIWAAGGGSGAFCRIDWNEYPFNGSELIDLAAMASGLFVTLNIYGDGVLRASRNVIASRPVRLPSGFKCSTWEVELLGTVSVRRVILATSMAELNQQ